MLAGLAGCPEPDPDPLPADDDDATPQALRTVVSPTAGGGTASSDTHRAQIVIGPPQPAGKTASDSNSATLGGAAR